MKKIAIIAKLLLSCVIVFGLVWIIYELRTCSFKTETEIGTRENIQVEETPLELNSIRRIGQWEFLSISMEEMIDSTKRGLLFDDRMVCIYRGTLSLGLNMEQCDSSWIVSCNKEKKSIVLSLPPITQLDRRFINEAQTRVFLESGSWSEREKAQLYQKAQQKMQRFALSPENRKTAEKHARYQITKLMHSMGFDDVTVSFQQPRGGK